MGSIFWAANFFIYLPKVLILGASSLPVFDVNVIDYHEVKIQGIEPFRTPGWKGLGGGAG